MSQHTYNNIDISVIFSFRFGSYNLETHLTTFNAPIIVIHNSILWVEVELFNYGIGFIIIIEF